jgi:hypothetical protein
MERYGCSGRRAHGSPERSSTRGVTFAALNRSEETIAVCDGVLARAAASVTPLSPIPGGDGHQHAPITREQTSYQHSRAGTDGLGAE